MAYTKEIGSPCEVSRWVASVCKQGESCMQGFPWKSTYSAKANSWALRGKMTAGQMPACTGCNPQMAAAWASFPSPTQYSRRLLHTLQTDLPLGTRSPSAVPSSAALFFMLILPYTARGLYICKLWFRTAEHTTSNADSAETEGGMSSSPEAAKSAGSPLREGSQQQDDAGESLTASVRDSVQSESTALGTCEAPTQRLHFGSIPVCRGIR